MTIEIEISAFIGERFITLIRVYFSVFEENVMLTGYWVQ